MSPYAKDGLTSVADVRGALDAVDLCVSPRIGAREVDALADRGVRFVFAQPGADGGGRARGVPAPRRRRPAGVRAGWTVAAALRQWTTFFFFFTVRGERPDAADAAGCTRVARFRAGVRRDVARGTAAPGPPRRRPRSAAGPAVAARARLIGKRRDGVSPRPGPRSSSRSRAADRAWTR